MWNISSWGTVFTKKCYFIMYRILEIADNTCRPPFNKIVHFFSSSSFFFLLPWRCFLSESKVRENMPDGVFMMTSNRKYKLHVTIWRMQFERHGQGNPKQKKTKHAGELHNGKCRVMCFHRVQKSEQPVSVYGLRFHYSLIPVLQVF